MQEDAPGDQAREAPPRRVGRVPHHRVTDGVQMDPDLVGAARLQAERDERRRHRRVEAGQHAVGGAGLSSPGRDRHARGTAVGAADGRVDHAPLVVHVPVHEGHVAPVDGVRRQLLDERPVGALGARHRQQARGPLVQAVHDPGAVGLTHPARRQFLEIGEAGQEAVDQGAPAPAGARVDDQPGRLVDDHDVVVDRDDRERHRRVGAGVPLRRVGAAHAELAPGSHGRAALGDDRAVEGDCPRRHERRHLGARRPGQHGHHAVDPHAVEERRDLGGEHPVVAPGPGVRAARPGAHAARPSACATRPPRSCRTMSEKAPSVMQASATLNVDQCVSVMKSTTDPRWRAEQPVAQVPERPAQHQAGGDRDPAARRPPGQPGQHPGQHRLDRAEQQGGAREQAERGARVVAEGEAEWSEQVDGPRTEPRRREGLGHLVHRHDGARGGEPDAQAPPPRRAGAAARRVLRRAGAPAQRRDNPPLLQATHSRARTAGPAGAPWGSAAGSARRPRRTCRPPARARRRSLRPPGWPGPTGRGRARGRP